MNQPNPIRISKLSADEVIQTLSQVELFNTDELSLVSTLKRKIIALIREGKLTAGQKLPSTRVLSQTMKVSRNTAISVYSQLNVEGFITSRGASGTLVNDVAARIPLTQTAPEEFAFSDSDDSFAKLADLALPETCTSWQTLAATAGADQSKMLKTIRERLSEHLQIFSGIDCTADQIVPIISYQQAVMVILSAMADSQTPVIVEDPGSKQVTVAASLLGCPISVMPIDEQGMCLNYTPEPEQKPPIIFTTCNSNFPTGVRMSNQRRAQIVREINNLDAVLIEQDLSHEFSRSLMSLSSLVPKTITLVAFGWISLPICIMIAPKPIALKLNRLAQTMDAMPDYRACQTLVNYFSGDWMYRQVGRRQKDLRERRAKIIDALSTLNVPGITLMTTPIGATLCLRLPAELDDIVVARTINQQIEVNIHPLSSFYDQQRHAQHGLVIPYGFWTSTQLEKAASTLPSLLRKIAHRSAAASVPEYPAIALNTARSDMHATDGNPLESLHQST